MHKCKQPNTSEINFGLWSWTWDLTSHKDPTRMDLQTRTEKLHQCLPSSDQVRALLVCIWKESRPHAQVY